MRASDEHSTPWTRLKFIPWAMAAFVLLALGTFHFIADSEFWPVTLAGEFFHSTAADPALSYKAIFHLPLALIYLIPHLSNVAHLYLAKFLFAAIGLVAIYLYARWARLVHGEEGRWAALAILLMSCLFFSQYHRIRSDILACALALLHLQYGRYILLRDQRLNRPYHWAGAILLSLVIYFTTPKALYFLALNLVYLVFAARGVGVRLFIPKIIGVCTLGAMSIFLLAQRTWFASFDWARGQNSAFSYFITQVAPAPAHALKFDGWIFYERYFWLDLPFWLLLGVSAVLLIVRPRRFFAGESGAGAVTAWVAVLLMTLHPQRFPFFLASLFPYAMMPVVGLLAAGLRQAKSHRQWRVALAAYGIFTLVWIAIEFTPQYWWASSAPQMAAIDQIEGYLQTLPDKTYFDGAGILPRSTTIYAFWGPGDADAIFWGLEKLKQAKPALVLNLSHAFLAGRRLDDILEAAYFDTKTGAWVRNDLINAHQYPLTANLKLLFSFEPVVYPRLSRKGQKFWPY